MRRAEHLSAWDIADMQPASPLKNVSTCLRSPSSLNPAKIATFKSQASTGLHQTAHGQHCQHMLYELILVTLSLRIVIHRNTGQNCQHTSENTQSTQRIAQMQVQQVTVTQCK